MGIRKSALLAGFLIVMAATQAGAQMIRQMEFKNQKIGDILLVLAQISGRSIIADETVEGNASFFFSETDFPTALNSFLSAYRLYSSEENGIIRVSRIRIRRDAANGDLIAVDAEDVEAQQILRAISRFISVAIVADALPRDLLSIHSGYVEPLQAVEIVVSKYPAFTVVDEPNLMLVRKADAANPAAARPAEPDRSVTRTETGSYSVDFEQASFYDLLEQLMAFERKEYTLLTRGDILLDRLRLSDKPFDQLLTLILERAGADFALRDGIYYFFEVQRNDPAEIFQENVLVRLTNIPAMDAVQLIPSEIATAIGVKADKTTNTLILTGKRDGIDPIIEFLGQIDVPLEGRSYYRIQSKFLKAKDLAALIPPRLSPVPPILTPDDEAFIVLMDEPGKARLDDFLATVDRLDEAVPINLKYIRAEDLIKNLPPGIAKEDLIDSGYPSLVFYTGTASKLEVFRRQLALIDKPQPQIRYNVLVIQYQKSDDFDWSKGLDVERAAEPLGLPFALTGKFANLVSLGFDVIASFGYSFAANLSLKIGVSSANVFADTTLTAISGRETKFQNTSTFRYRDLEVDPDTGDVKTTGVTRELTSGLVIGLNGWVSGNGMVTMAVSASVSERGTESAGSVNQPPATTERIVNTQLRAKSGQMVTISGLTQWKKTETVSKIPWLGDIPFIGAAFRDIKEVDEETEMVIYIVPRVIEPAVDEADTGLAMERMYAEFSAGRGD
jgi:type II secretory pathway component GspD/PulD (secretin)